MPQYVVAGLPYTSLLKWLPHHFHFSLGAHNSHIDIPMCERLSSTDTYPHCIQNSSTRMSQIEHVQNDLSVNVTSWDRLSWAELCAPSNSYVDSLTPNTSECDLGDRVFKGMIKLKRALYDGPPSIMTAVLIRRVNLDTRQACAQSKDHVKTQEENDHMYIRERGLRRNQPCQHFDLRPQYHKKINFSCVSHLICGIY